MRQNSLGGVFDHKSEEEEQFAAKRRNLQRKYRLWTIGIAAVLLIAILCLLFSQCRADKDDIESPNNMGANQQATTTLEDSPIQLDWSDWMDALPGYATSEDYVIEEQTLYRSRALETTSSTTQNTMDGWELYDTIEGTGNFGNWTDWSATAVHASETREVETQTRYRYRDKETTTGSSSSMSGWELYDTTYSWGNYGSWSSWSTNAVAPNDSRRVETKTQYSYRDKWITQEYSDWSGWSDWQNSGVSEDHLTKVETRTVYMYCYFQCPHCGVHMHGWGFTCPTWAGGCGQVTIPEGSYHEVWGTIPQSEMGFSDWYGTGHTYAYYNGELVFRNIYGDQSKTQYRYATRTLNNVTNYGNWSSWGDTAYSASSTREVQTRTAYRYCDRQQIPTYHFWRWGSWSGWATDAISQTSNRQVETMPYYRYRDKVFVTTYYFRRWGEWSDYSITAITESDTVEVETKTQYRYKSK